MSGNLFEQTRMTDLDKATREYGDAKQNYQRLVRIATQEPDPARREEQFKGIRAENARLVRVVEGLVAAWSEYDTDLSSSMISNLDEELAQFKRDLSELHHKQDTVVQLQSVLATLSGENDSARSTYYGYIIAVLVLLIIVFIIFVYSYVSSAFTAIPEPVMPAMPSLPPLSP